MQELNGTVSSISRDATGIRQVTIALDKQGVMVTYDSFTLQDPDGQLQLDQRVLVTVDAL